MNYFPIFLTANKLKTLVVGGGDVAARKIELLLKTTKNISVMSQSVNFSVERLINENELTHLAHDFDASPQFVIF